MENPLAVGTVKTCKREEAVGKLKPVESEISLVVRWSFLFVCGFLGCFFLVWFFFP